MSSRVNLPFFADCAPFPVSTSPSIGRTAHVRKSFLFYTSHMPSLLFKGSCTRSTSQSTRTSASRAGIGCRRPRTLPSVLVVHFLSNKLPTPRILPDMRSKKRSASLSFTPHLCSFHDDSFSQVLAADWPPLPLPTRNFQRDTRPPASAASFAVINLSCQAELAISRRENGT